MTTENDRRYLSQWEAGRNSLTRFEAGIEATRKHFEVPLAVIYKALYEDQAPSGNLLVLGIGTGQVETMAQILSERITGVDVSGQFLSKAGQRLVSAKLIAGRIQDVLPTLERFITTTASDVLDCFNVSELEKLLQLIRDKTYKLLVTQVFTPNDEFYAPHSRIMGVGSHGGPGIEGWSAIQHEAVEQFLLQSGIASDPFQSATLLLNEIQSFVESVVGGKLIVNIVEQLQRRQLLLTPNELSGVRNRSFVSKINLFLEMLISKVDEARNTYYRAAYNQEGINAYIAIHTLHRVLQLFHGTLQTEYYFIILKNLTQQAGFAQVVRGALTATNDQLVDNSEVAGNINKSLLSMSEDENRIHTITSGVFVNGVPMTFFVPSSNPYISARVQYLVAS